MFNLEQERQDRAVLIEKIDSGAESHAFGFGWLCSASDRYLCQIETQQRHVRELVAKIRAHAEDPDDGYDPLDVLADVESILSIQGWPLLAPEKGGQGNDYGDSISVTG